MKTLGVCLLLLVWSAQSGAAIVKAPRQHSASNGADAPKPDQPRQKPKFVPAPTNHYALASRQTWHL